MGFTLAIVGRPNVGKSTLFNRLAGRRLALVHDSPGFTRDVREATVRYGPMQFTLLDTAGVTTQGNGALTRAMRAHSESACTRADACLLLFDARAGLTGDDYEIASMLRKSGARVILLANKAEGREGHARAMEGFALGFDEPLAISAEHGEGIDALMAAIASLFLPAQGSSPGSSSPSVTAGGATGGDASFRIALLGRPNCGKSTLANRLIGEERMLVGEEAGVTRDSIASVFEWKGGKAELFDTAGLRKKARIAGEAERLSVSDALRAVRFAQIVIFLMDARMPFEAQDLRLLDLVVREGRSVVALVNKIDLLAPEKGRAARLRKRFDALVPRLAGAPVLTVSALRGDGLGRLHDALMTAQDKWRARIPTAALNRWLAAMESAHPPPLVNGRRVRLRYMTQAKSRPPRFALFCSRPGALPVAYLRYLENGLRADFHLTGTPIRIYPRAGKNPYVSR